MTKISLKDKTRSIVEMSGLREVESSLRSDKVTEKGSTINNDGIKYDKATEKRSTVNDNGVECDKAMEKRLTVDDDGIRYDKATEKRLTIDDNGIRSTSLAKSSLGGRGSSLSLGLGMSGLESISSSLYCERRLQCY